ncbi:hypothetical protein ANCDUO_04726 [Ancylostoma duodenale]|uniref:Uncharacterized protein n=1 Tax=Ancylostoma duodenale TaxID=51022 RepID=A0A0C2D5V7_9BILA|nr:hypothetical protein ANCDUO_04726 [Ancylostoma duodenale]
MLSVSLYTNVNNNSAVVAVISRYNIVVTEYPGPLKTGLGLLKDEQPNIVAVLMGSRATDPRGKYMK